MCKSKKIKTLLLGALLAGVVHQSAQAAPAAAQGVITAREFLNISGTTLPALTDSPKFPNSPDVVAYPTLFEWPANPDGSQPAGDVKNNYGVQIIGFLYPPTTGDYQFALAADDNAVLYLSTDDNPANKVAIANEPSWNPVRAFSAESRRGLVDVGTADERRVNISKKIRLTAGRAYYIEALMKEGGGGDNLAVAWAKPGDPLPQDGDQPIPGQFLAPISTVTQATILAHPQDAAVFAGNQVSFTVGIDVGPTGKINSVKWTRNGVDIPNSNSTTLSFAAAAADDGAKYRAIVDTSVGTVQSNEATLIVASLVNEPAPGLMKWEAWTGLGGVDLQTLKDDPRYPNSPDQVRFVSGYEGPPGWGDNYGARVSGYITPQATGNYVFFVSADDHAELYLSTDENPANKKLIAQETNWSNVREWTTSGGSSDLTSKRSDEFGGTEWPTGNTITLTAGRRYYTELLYKEGGGGDNGAVAMIKAGDPAPANSSSPVTGNLISAASRPNKGDVTITKQPASVSTDEGRTVTLSVEASTTPAAFNLPLIVKWQKNGADIPGATSTTYTIANAKVADSGTYRAVLSAAGIKTVNSSEAVVTVTPDTNGPVITAAGAVKKGNNIEIGVAFDEKVDVASASAASAYALSKGTVQSVRYVPQSSGVVLVASGLNAGDTVTVTASGLKDTLGNVRASTSKEVRVPAKLMTWTGVGGDELNTTLNRQDFNDDVVARGEKDFDLISGGSAHWTNYDEQTFVYEEVTGDFDKVVRVEYQDPVTQWSRSGLDAREALDEGKTRDDVSSGYKFSQHFTVRVNPPAIQGWDGRTGNNAYEVIHRPVEGGNYDGYNAMFAIQNGSSMAPNYPNAWLRLKREGQKLTAYRSGDGRTWNVAGEVTYQDDPDSPEDERLASKLFVGMFYGPEFLNINDEEQRKSRAASIAKFRDYGDFAVATTGAIQGVQLSGGQVVITFTGALEQADSVTGPWTAVTGASPLRVNVQGKAAQFFRVKK